MSDTAPHVPVLARESLHWLGIQPDGIYVDGTAGAGGHSSLIAEQLVDGGRLIALDRDPEAVALARARLAAYPHAQVIQRNYGDLAAVLSELGVDGVDGVLIDAGCSSMQLDEAERGFSLDADGPLDMRMDPSTGEPASELLARISAEELAEMLKQYGDVGPARRVANTIVERARARTLDTTADLVAAVGEALSFVQGQPQEVRTVFQAVRIAVNEEFRWLQAGIEQAVAALRPGGRVVVITFHSGEDRVAKTVLRAASRKREELYPDGRRKSVVPAELKLLTRAPVTASDEELLRNSRAKSAKLRAAQRLGAGD